MFEEYLTDETKRILDIIITSIYIFELFYYFARSTPPKTNYLKRIDTWIDVITIITPLFTYIYTNKNLKLVRVLRILKVLRILRLGKIIRRYTILTT